MFLLKEILITSLIWVLLLGLFMPRKSPIEIFRVARHEEWDHKRIRNVFIMACLANNLISLPLLIYMPAMPAGFFFGETFLLLLFIRIQVGRLRHEKGSGWLFYSALAWLSPIWIPLFINNLFDIIQKNK